MLVTRDCDTVHSTHVVAYEAKNALPEICCRMKIQAAICAKVSDLDWCLRAGNTHHRAAEIGAPEAVVLRQQTKPVRRGRQGRAAHMSSHDPLSAIFDSAMACSMASISMTVCPASTSISGRSRSSIASALSRCPCEMSHRGDSEPGHQRAPPWGGIMEGINLRDVLVLTRSPWQERRHDHGGYHGDRHGYLPSIVRLGV